MNAEDKKFSKEVEELSDRISNEKSLSERLTGFIAQLTKMPQKIADDPEIDFNEEQMEAFNLGIYSTVELFRLNFKKEIKEADEWRANRNKTDKSDNKDT